MPRWAIWICNIAVVAILSALTAFLKWTGAEFAFGVFVGMMVNYAMYKNWRQDYENERTPHFTD